MNYVEKNPKCEANEVRKEIKSLGIKICELKQINKGLKQVSRPKLATKTNNRSCSNRVKEKGLQFDCNTQKTVVKKPVIGT